MPYLSKETDSSKSKSIRIQGCITISSPLFFHLLSDNCSGLKEKQSTIISGGSHREMAMLLICSLAFQGSVRICIYLTCSSLKGRLSWYWYVQIHMWIHLLMCIPIVEACDENVIYMVLLSNSLKNVYPGYSTVGNTHSTFEFQNEKICESSIYRWLNLGRLFLYGHCLS